MSIIDQIEREVILKAAAPGQTREQKLVTVYARDVFVIACRAMRTMDKDEIGAAGEALMQALAFLMASSTAPESHPDLVDTFCKILDGKAVAINELRASSR